jgi:hypothetical protein
MQAGRAPGWLRHVRSRLGARGFAARVVQLIRLAILVIEGIIAVRVLLKVAGANAQAGFTSFVDGLSSPFVGPFHPVFADQLLNGHPLEVGSLLAMGVYALLAYAAIRVVRGLFSPAHV